MQETTKYLLIGGGVASVSAAKAIRELDKEGRVLLLTADSYMPYDRPPLSKGFLGNHEVTHDDISSKFDHWYPENKIEVKLETQVASIERASSKVTLKSGESISYGKVLLATGSRARKLEVPGDGMPIFTLRSLSDAIALRDAMDSAKSVVVVGTGFLGPEVASQCAAKGIKTTIVGHGGSIWDRFASPALGEFLTSYYRAKGITLLLNDTVSAIEKGRVKTASGASAEADFVLLAVGGEPNSELAKNSGLKISEHDGGVISDLYLKTSDENFYVAGDIAHFPDEAVGRPIRHEHHLNAQWQGAAAGANMAGAGKPYEKVSYFFSDFLDLHMIQRGAATSHASTKVIGDMSSGDFVELYGDADGTLKMGLAINREEKKLDPISDKLESLIADRAHFDALTVADFE
jgi:3-phenylpropionate/trans-cinnamate dioxygenase ferredoxin reductase subunit